MIFQECLLNFSLTDSLTDFAKKSVVISSTIDLIYQSYLVANDAWLILD